MIRAERPEAIVDLSMPVYLEDEPPPVAEPEPQPRARPSEPHPVVTARPSTYSSWFIRLVSVSAASLPSCLEAWWLVNSRDAIVTVDGRFRLGQPRLERGVWTMRTRLHVGRLHNVPLLLDLWPHSGDWTSLVLRPQVKVATSSRYFRVGHRAIDCFLEDLVS